MSKILIIRFSSIGDIVLTTPVIRCLKLQLAAEVHFLTKQSYHSILVANPYLSKIYTIQKKVSEVLTDLKKEGYDYVIDLHKNLRSAQVKFALSASATSFDKLNWQKWLLVNLKINRMPAVHIVDRYLQTVAFLDVTNDGAGLDYFIPSDVTLGGSFDFSNKKIIVFAIGAAHQTKRLPTEKITKICQEILDRTHQEDNSCLIALIGGPAEAEEGAQIVKNLGYNGKLQPNEHKKIINLCGKISLNQSALLIQKANLVITHDTGMMHIAAAFKKRIISIWGNTVPEFGMYPYYPNGVNKNKTIEVQNLNCRPCSKIGHAQCPRGHFNCMQQIEPQNVAETVKLLTKTDFN